MTAAKHSDTPSSLRPLVSERQPSGPLLPPQYVVFLPPHLPTYRGNRLLRKSCQRRLICSAVLLIFGAAAYVLWPSDPKLSVVRLSLDRLHFHTTPKISLDVTLDMTIKKCCFPNGPKNWIKREKKTLFDFFKRAKLNAKGAYVNKKFDVIAAVGESMIENQDLNVEDINKIFLEVNLPDDKASYMAWGAWALHFLLHQLQLAKRDAEYPKLQEEQRLLTEQIQKDKDEVAAQFAAQP
ncbi:hypothetical protein OROGR_011813 [Orobanche gracilis]